MFSSFENKDDMKNLEDLADFQSKLKQVRLAEKFGN